MKLSNNSFEKSIRGARETKSALSTVQVNAIPATNRFRVLYDSFAMAILAPNAALASLGRAAVVPTSFVEGSGIAWDGME